MKAYRLKPGQEAFQVVDGPCEGVTFRPGMTYHEIPPREAGRFEEVPEPAVEEKPKSKRGTDQ